MPIWYLFSKTDPKYRVLKLQPTITIIQIHVSDKIDFFAQ